MLPFRVSQCLPQRCHPSGLRLPRETQLPISIAHLYVPTFPCVSTTPVLYMDLPLRAHYTTQPSTRAASLKCLSVSCFPFLQLLQLRLHHLHSTHGDPQEKTGPSSSDLHPPSPPFVVQAFAPSPIHPDHRCHLLPSIQTIVSGFSAQSSRKCVAIFLVSVVSRSASNASYNLPVGQLAPHKARKCVRPTERERERKSERDCTVVSSSRSFSLQ